MLKHYLPGKLIFCVLVFAVGFNLLPAQTIQYLNSNNIIAGIAIGGNLFSDSIPISQRNADLFQTKFDSGRAEIYTAALWMNGFDELGSLRGAGQMDGEWGVDYFDGPIVNTYDSIYDRYYKRVFKITQTQIAAFRSLSFPTSSSLIDSAILYWPAKGNPAVLSDYGVSIGTPLAPFADINNNGIYEPHLGEYPGICGDQAIFFVYNDIRGNHTECNCNPLGVEIRGLASSFSDTSTNGMTYDKRALNNSIIVQYEIENKSQHSYSSFDLGQWLDPDIGCFNNDYAGCDSSKNLMFAYNGTTFDPDCSPDLGFGNLPVALGVQFLNQPMNVFGVFGNGNVGPAQSDPGVVCGRYRNYLQGLWADDSPFEYGQNGYYSGGHVTKFLFSGDPNDTTEWSEVSNRSIAGDRRMYGSTDSLNFNPGQIIHFDIGYTTSFDSTSNFVKIIDTLKRDADVVRAFYNNHIIPCQHQFALGINEMPKDNPFTVSIYPNPANNIVTIDASVDMQTVELMDIQGRLLFRKTVEAKKVLIPVSALAKGVYLVNVQSAGNSVVKKIVIE